MRQIACLLLVLTIAALVRPGPAAFAVMVALVLAHSILAFLDVAYTDNKRIISPLEQAVHGYMEVCVGGVTAHPWSTAAGTPA